MEQGSKTEKKVCDKHGPYEAKIVSIGPVQHATMCPECEKEEEAAAKQAEAEEEQERGVARIKKAMDEAEIPARFKSCRFTTYRTDTEAQQKVFNAVIKYNKNLMQKDYCSPLFLTGSYGTGKTHLAVAVLVEAIIRGTQCKYTRIMKMIRDIRSTYHPNSSLTEQQVIDKYIRVPLLVLDEVGVQTGTDNEKLLLFEVLNGRYEEMKPTILISNLPYEGLKDYLTERVMDRLKGKTGVLARFDWDSERGKV